MEKGSKKPAEIQPDKKEPGQRFYEATVETIGMWRKLNLRSQQAYAEMEAKYEKTRGA